MDSDIFSTIFSHYNWQAALAAVAGIAILTTVGKWLVFKVPALARTRQLNRVKDKEKWALEKYPPVVRATQKVGKYVHFFVYPVVLPFVVTLQRESVGQVLLDIFIVLMVYDFFYYLSHRFWFHGNGPMRKIHAVHHQARSPTYLDAHYVHPTETFIGLALFFGTVAGVAALTGPLALPTVLVTFIIFYQLNQINHTHVDLPYFPFKTVSWITAKHAIHHENMHKGNYATITLFYDKLFGTLD